MQIHHDKWCYIIIPKSNEKNLTYISKVTPRCAFQQLVEKIPRPLGSFISNDFSRQGSVFITKHERKGFFHFNYLSVLVKYNYHKRAI